MSHIVGLGLFFLECVLDLFREYIRAPKFCNDSVGFV